ncbi:MAG TPA: dihydrolipoyl dehydrogenase [Hyphomicrobium sp.]|nr:dihydrolipoyl dehydrogenase [Hyphomicrobium sp.]
MAGPYDLIVIGTGPGGYVCAIRAAQLGLKVAVVEKRPTHGGACLNVGCIPSKALLHASHAYDEARHGFAAMGIKATAELDLAKMLAFKAEGVKGNVDGVAYLLKKNKIDSYHGAGKVLGAGKVEITFMNGEQRTLEAKSIVVATGSEPAALPGIEIDEKQVITSTGALELPEVPGKMIVIGAGVIGLELGSVWRRLGADVLVVEFLDRILPGMDGEVARSFQRILEKQGLKFRLGCKVTGVTKDGDGKLKATIAPAAGGDAEAIEADVVLVAVGRVPHVDGLGLAEAGIAVDAKKRILVDGQFQTNVAGVYAIGDVIAGPMLAHKAEDEGIAVAENIAGQAGRVNHDVIPSVVYTFPEVACVGKTEEELKSARVAYATGKFPFTANGRAKVNRTTDGFVKILADAKTDRILGVHMIGPNVSEIIAEAAVIMEFSGSAEDLARTCHAHPTLTEAVKEAALAVAKRQIHM